MELLVLNTDLESVAVVDEYTSLIWTDRYSDYGDFELYTTINDYLFRSLQPNYYLWSADSKHTMIIESREISADSEDGKRLIVKGRSLESILTRRIVWDATTISGNLQDSVKKLLEENVISPKDSKRKIPNFIFVPSDDPVITKLTLDGQFVGCELFEAIKTICDAVSIGFQITLNDNNQFVFKLYAGTDRSYAQMDNPYVMFSPKFENIINSNYLETNEALKTVTLVAGEDDGTKQTFLTVERTDSGSGLERREMYTDARYVSSKTSDKTLSEEEYNALLKAKGDEDLAANVTKRAFEGQVEATHLFVFGEDFFMGDIVQVANEEGIESKSRVVEMVFSINDSGRDSYPTFEILE